MTQNTRKKVEYVPPPQAVIDQAAQSVCQKVAEGNPDFEPAKVVYGRVRAGDLPECAGEDARQSPQPTQ